MMGTNKWWERNDLDLTIKLYKQFISKSFIQFDRSYNNNKTKKLYLEIIVTYVYKPLEKLPWQLHLEAT